MPKTTATAEPPKRLFPNDVRVSTRSFERAVKHFRRAGAPKVAAVAQAVQANREAYDEWLSRRVRRPAGA